MKFYAFWNLNLKELFSIFKKKNSHFDKHKIIQKQVFK